MSKIKKIEAKEIRDSRGNPTIEARVWLVGGASGSASVPSGASTGLHEALELRDNKKTKGVTKALKNINVEIAKNIIDKDFDQKKLDKFLISLDGTENKSRLGGNAILAISLAFARACARERGEELYRYIAHLTGRKGKFTLPTPALNVINGGKHAKNGIDFQEFMFLPTRFKTFREKIFASEKIISALRKSLTKAHQLTTLGDEGGFAPKLKHNEEALDYIEHAIEDAGYKGKVLIALDAAATSFYDGGLYKFEGKKIKGAELLQIFQKLCATHPIISIEDPFHEEDFASFAKINKILGSKIHIVGDDLTVTNPLRIAQAIKSKAINTVLIKPNQIGTLTETLEAIALARKNKLDIFVSHRSGETMDTFIADLAVGVGAKYIKAGSLTKPERKVKYSRLLAIEAQLTK